MIKIKLMKKIVATYLLLFIVIINYSFAQSSDGYKFYPTNWWVGMKNPDVQLMIHGAAVGKAFEWLLRRVINQVLLGKCDELRADGTGKYKRAAKPAEHQHSTRATNSSENHWNHGTPPWRPRNSQKRRCLSKQKLVYGR